MNKYRPLTLSTSCLRSALYRPQGHVLIASPPRKHQAHPSVPRSQRRYLNTQDQAVRFTTGLNNFQTATGVLLFALGGFYYYYHHATMSGKLIPSNPSDVMVIRDITPNVVTLSVPFSRFGRLHIGGRGTLVRLTSGKIAVVSPVALTPEVKAKVAQLGGAVAYIIAPDFEHHIFVSEWAKEYPDAKIVGPEGLPEKRQKMKDEKIGDESFAYVYTAANRQYNEIDGDFVKDFDVEYMDMHPNKEIVLFYKPEKILIEADLLFNLPAIEQYSKVPDEVKNSNGFLNRAFANLQGTSGDALGTKRFLWYGMSSKNRPAWNEAVKRIDTWDFHTIIPCHGETIEGNAKEIFRKVFEWHLQGHK